MQLGPANIFFNSLNFVFPLGHPRPPKRCPNWMLIFVVMGDQVQDDMALKFLIFTLGKILQNFFSKIDGNSWASPQCEKSKRFFIIIFWASNMYVIVQTRPSQYFKWLIYSSLNFKIGVSGYRREKPAIALKMSKIKNVLYTSCLHVSCRPDLKIWSL